MAPCRFLPAGSFLFVRGWKIQAHDAAIPDKMGIPKDKNVV